MQKVIKYAGALDGWLESRERENYAALQTYTLAVWAFLEKPKQFETSLWLAWAEAPAEAALREIRNVDSRGGDCDAIEAAWEGEWLEFADVVDAIVRKYQKVFKGNGEIIEEGKRSAVSDVLWTARQE